MLTMQHVEEDLSRAYIQAVAAKAGVNLDIGRSHDYTVDGTFHHISYIRGQREESGLAIDFQLKASKNCIFGAGDIKYDFDADTYNYLGRRATTKHAAPIILLLLALHPDDTKWMEISEDELILRKCCYWIKLSSSVTSNEATKRITIPRSQQFDHLALRQMFDRIQSTGDVI